MKTPTQVREKKCPPPELVVAYVMNDQDVTAPEELGQHIEQCSACRQLVQETAQTRGVLRMQSDVASADLSDRILASLPEDDVQAVPLHFPRWRDYGRTALGIAAAVVLLLGVIHLVQRPRILSTERREHTVSTALYEGQHWLLGHQERNGGWDVATLDGKPEYDEALNGLAILAVLSTDQAMGANEKVHLKRAADYLITHQDLEGCISRNKGAAMYNHGIATLALLEIEKLTGDQDLAAPIDQAVAWIVQRQTASGGWGYHGRSAVPNTSITTWQVKALLQARAQGRQVSNAILKKALHWLTGTVGPQGYFGYQTAQTEKGASPVLTMMGAHCLFSARESGLMQDSDFASTVLPLVKRLAQQAPSDYHQTYFTAAVIAQLQEPDPVFVAQDIRQALLSRQILSGAELGCWKSDGDRWNKPGGRIYSTSMAMLALSQKL